jgi:aspartate racemase
MSLTVGVIGGMGPAATTHFLARVQALTPVAHEKDHLHLLVDCNPQVPELDDAAAGGPSPAEIIAGMAAGLERMGAQILAMPCNAAHAYAADIRAAVSIPFIHLIDAVCEATAVYQPAAVGLLAADACLEANLYQEGFERRGIEVLTQDAASQEEFMELLFRIKTGDVGEAVRRRVRQMAEVLISDGAEVIVAGCTEVPLVLTYEDISTPLADSLEILARRTVEAARATG